MSSIHQNQLTNPELIIMYHRLITHARFGALLVLGVLVLLSGCLPFIKKPPAVDQIFTETSDTAFRIDVKALPINWDDLDAKKTQLESAFVEPGEDPVYAIINTLQIEPREILTVAGCTYGLKEYLALDEEDRTEQPNWVCAIDIDRKLAVEEILKAIAEDKHLEFTAKMIGKEQGFDLLEIRNKHDESIFNLALYSGNRSQIRFGNPASVVSSLNNTEDYVLVREDMLRLEAQSWFFAKIPEELNDNLNQFETMLPFEPGALVSGFMTAVFSVEANGPAIDSTLALEFENEDQANTAFSYLQLGLNFALKPYLRKKTDGQASHFIRSIRNENTEDIVKLSFSVNGKDLESLEQLLEGNIPPVLLSFLDLIK